MKRVINVAQDELTPVAARAVLLQVGDVNITALRAALDWALGESAWSGNTAALAFT